MIYIADQTDLVPHLFALSDQFVRCKDHADVEIWPAAISNEITESSDVFTIFVNQECNIHFAEHQYYKHRVLRPNSIFAITAFNSNYPWPFSTIKFWSNIYMTFKNNKNLQPLDVDIKPYDGCALFGGWEVGRARMFDRLQHLNLVDQCLINLQPKWIDNDRFTLQQRLQHKTYRSPQLPDLDLLEFNNLAYTATGLNTMMLTDNNRYSWVSLKIPWQLYNHSYLSIVAETEFFPWQDTIFLTEKIAKPLIAGHPFMIYGGPGILKYLQVYGFQTFSSWIDESYDVLQGENRADAMIRSFAKFSKQPADAKLDMFKEMQTVCKHNQRLATDPEFLLSPIVETILQKFC